MKKPKPLAIPPRSPARRPLPPLPRNILDAAVEVHPELGRIFDLANDPEVHDALAGAANALLEPAASTSRPATGRGCAAT